MSDRSKIEWCDASLNPIRAKNRATGKTGHFCEHVSPGCLRCYSEAYNRRGIGAGVAFQRQNRDRVEITLDEKTLLQPLRWRRPRTIFWCSMTDAFAEFVPDAMLDRMFAVAALTPQHRHLFLTKRGDRMADYLRGAETRIARLTVQYPVRVQLEGRRMRLGLPLVYGGSRVEGFVEWPLADVFLGVSVEDQARADERVAALAVVAHRGWKTFVSYEPALGPVEWSGWEFLKGLIAGGESGPEARPSHPDWRRSARDFCAANGIAFFHKQNGAFVGLPEAFDHGIRPETIARAELSTIDGLDLVRVGKKAAGRLLDGREWNEVPA